MKHNEVPNVSYKITPQNYENIFNIFQDEDGTYFYNLIKTVNIPEELSSSVFTFYETSTQDTWPLISWRFYKNVKLWWIICAANQIQDPTQQPIPGTKLKIINNIVVKNLLNTLE